MPAEVTLRTQDGKDIDAALGLPTAHTPAFAPDGSKVCLIGSHDLWTVDVESEALARYDLLVAEAPVPWQSPTS
ncbi:MAG: hypothetical protein JW990_00880 [Thermoleophilia bacterium]|nr:hypothetical protein [Thermoleophilia bacterium]